MPNELARETSPYLLQHADNPVDWMPWNEASLALARERDLPILLSIGYSACHWCHVMAHESFEDEPTARLMNELFVNIKVDREERPDIDKIYQAAHQLVSGSAGGWPLTVFLTPGQLPIFTGTYFSRVVFQQVLTRVASYFRHNRDEADRRGAALREALHRLDRTMQGEAAPDADTSASGEGDAALDGGDAARHGGATASGEGNAASGDNAPAPGAAGPAPVSDDAASDPDAPAFDAGRLALDAAPLERARERLQASFDPDYGGFGGAPKFPHSNHVATLLRAWRRTAGASQRDQQATQPDVETFRPGQEATQPDVETSRPDQRTTQPDAGVPRPNAGTGQPGADAPRPDTEPTQPDAETPQRVARSSPPQTKALQPDARPPPHTEPPPDAEALHMATTTLTRMAQGGLCDHLAGGFFRYSVDRRWEIPHFEKMLYDNAELLAVFADAYAATDDPFFADVAAATAEWIMAGMQDPEGGYYATLDADSEGEEGRYYLWTPPQVREALDAAEYESFSRLFGLTEAPNFENRAWHLQVRSRGDGSGTSQRHAGARSPKPVENGSPDPIETARRKLLAVRDRRAPPGRDEKVLTGWNGLTIRAMARAARHLGRGDLADSAARAAEFVATRLYRDGRLLACYKDGQARFPAYLDDYAFLADGLLELLRLRWRGAHLALARELAEVMLARFADPRGGFYFTADDHEALIHRPKPLADEATPSGNGVAVRVLLRLGALLGEPRYLNAAHRTLAAAGLMLERYPDAHGTLLHGLELALGEPEVVVVRSGSAATLQQWLRRVDSGFNPRRIAFGIPADANGLPGALAERRPRGEAVAYICRGTRCLAPITRLEDLA